MTDFKIFSNCENCRKRRWYIAKRRVPTPIGAIATSKKLLCGRCFDLIKGMLKTN